MTNDHPRVGPVPLPGRGGSGQSRRENSGDRDGGDWDNAGTGTGRAARGGISHARRMSNWSAAALIVGTGAAVVALAGAQSRLPSQPPAPRW
jgi:hypothetical protein